MTVNVTPVWVPAEVVSVRVEAVETVSIMYGMELIVMGRWFQPELAGVPLRSVTDVPLVETDPAAPPV